jgi:hypothetical protein
MPFRPNYRQQRGERDRAKQNKKQEKLRKRDEETAARRKTDPEADENGVAAPAPDSDPQDESSKE